MKNTVNKYFEVKVKMQKTQEDGIQKKVTEQYVVEAATFGEAERRITECLKPYIEGEFDVTDIKIAGYVQIVGGDENADKYFKAKVTFVALDETTTRTSQRTARTSGNGKDGTKILLALASVPKHMEMWQHKGLHGQIS